MPNRIEHSPALAHGEDSISDLQERVLTLLEEAGIPTETNDAIMVLILAAEIALAENEAFQLQCLEEDAAWYSKRSGR